jgi:prophage regulatory protein
MEWFMQVQSGQRSPAAEFDRPAPKFLRLPMVIHLTGLGRSTIYRLIAEKKFPGPVRLGDRAVAWRQADLDDWSDCRIPPAR